MNATRPTRLAPLAARLLATTVLATSFLASPAHARQQQPPDCTSPEHRAFDFWVGEWSIFTPDGRLVGENTITRETTSDGGATWSTSFDGLYRRR